MMVMNGEWRWYNEGGEMCVCFVCVMCVCICLYEVQVCVFVCLSGWFRAQCVCVCASVWWCAQAAWAIGDCVCESFPLCCLFVNSVHKVAFEPADGGAKFKSSCMCFFICPKKFDNKSGGANRAFKPIDNCFPLSSLPWLVSNYDSSRTMMWFNYNLLLLVLLLKLVLMLEKCQLKLTIYCNQLLLKINLVRQSSAVNYASESLVNRDSR